MAAPTALATAWCGTWTTSAMPGTLSGTRKQPPPTAISGTSLASLFIRSTLSSIIARMRASAARTSGAGREAVDGERLGDGGQHHGAVVLREVERGADPAGRERLDERARGAPGERQQAGVEQRHVLALQQSDAAEPVRERHRDVRAFLAED